MTSGVTCGVVFDTKIFLTKEGASFHRNTLSESGVMKNVGAKCLELFLSKFELQNHLFIGIFSVLPKSNISLRIAGSVISSNQERMVQSSYFWQWSNLLKNICERIDFLQILLKLANLLIY